MKSESPNQGPSAARATAHAQLGQEAARPDTKASGGGAIAGDVESVLWRELKREHPPVRAVELRAIVEIAMALHEALPQGPTRGAPAPHALAACVTRSGKAIVPKATRPVSIDRQAPVLAPEVRRGEMVDQSANLHCLGAMLFEAVTGKAFESGQQVRAELNQIRSNGRRPKGERSRDCELLMLAARTTFAEPAARGPEPRKFATHVVVSGGRQVASRQAFAVWVGAALDQRTDSSRSETPKPPLLPLAQLVIHAPPAGGTVAKSAASSDGPAGEAPPPAAPLLATGPDAQRTPPLEGEVSEAPAAASPESGQLAMSDPDDSAADGPDASVSAEELGAPASGAQQIAPAAARARSARSGSSHALLAVVATALLMAIATGAQVAKRGPHLHGGLDAIGQAELGGAGLPGAARRAQGGAAVQVNAAHADVAAKPGCPRPTDDDAARGAELSPHAGAIRASSDDGIELEPAGGSNRPRARKKSVLSAEPDYGI